MVLASALCFYLATVVIRWAGAHTDLDPAFFVLARFMLGFAVVAASLTLQGRRPRPLNYHYLLGRTLTNCAAVYCFFKAVAVSGVANANILNMTYPAFIALFTWIFWRAQRDLAELSLAGVAIAGAFLILAPGGLAPDWGSLWGLASGIGAAGAILYLNVSRRHHDSETILFYMFGLGTIITYSVFHDRLHLRSLTEIGFLVLASLFGIAGQYLLTLGFRHVTAVEGSILSSSRILMAAVIGPALALDPPLHRAGWLGALLILGANVCIALRREAPAAPALPLEGRIQ